MDDELKKQVHLPEPDTVLRASARRMQASRIAALRTSELPLCDERQLRRLSDLGALEDSEEIVSELVQLFIDEAAELVNRLPELAANSGEVVRAVHKLNGAAGYVGATRVAQFCSALEEDAQAAFGCVDHQTIAELREILIASINDYRTRLERK
jgi:HPt (histidine-containing phosphotransfer) domain-containing protein